MMAIRLGSKLPDFPSDALWLDVSAETSAFVDKPVLIHVWSIDCEQSLLSIRTFQQWQCRDELQSKLATVSVIIDKSSQSSDIGSLFAAARSHQWQCPLLLDVSQRWASDNLGAKCTPAFFLFDDQHKLRHFQSGNKGMTLLEQRIRSVLGLQPERSKHHESSARIEVLC